MPFQWQINIHPSGETSPRAVFDPQTLPAAPRDQIFWTNNDSVPHWPGPTTNGTIDPTGFIPNQIAPNGDTSATWSPTIAGTYPYACSLHPDEQGVIRVNT